MENLPLFTVFYTFQVLVWAFFHQPYFTTKGRICRICCFLPLQGSNKPVSISKLRITWFNVSWAGLSRRWVSSSTNKPWQKVAVKWKTEMILACLCSDFWDMCMIVVFGIGRTNLKFSHVLLMFLVTRPWILELRIKDWLHLIYSVNFWISWFVFPWLQKFGSICIPWYDHLYRSYTVPFHSSLLGLPNVTHEIDQHFFLCQDAAIYSRLLPSSANPQGELNFVSMPKVSRSHWILWHG